MEFIKKFMELTRAYALLVTFASCFVIYSYAHYNPNFTLTNFILLVFALCCVHLGANLFDDFIDVKLQLKKGASLNEVKFDGFIPKAILIRNGIFSLFQVKLIIFILFFIASLIGLYFIYNNGLAVMLYALIGGILALFYPISPKYRLAEIIIGLIYGPLMIMGGYFALTGEFSINLLWLSVSIFFSTIVLLHTHSIMDWEFDIKNNKKTLALLCKTKEKAIKMLCFLITASYITVLAGILVGIFNPNMLYVFLTLPIATKLIESIKDYINIRNVEFQPKWYLGFFENWNSIKQNKIDFFMYRFYLARNFGFFFALFASIGVIK